MTTYNQMNPHLNYALEKFGYSKDSEGIEQYKQDMLNRVGSVSANTGKELTQGDVWKELNRLGIQQGENEVVESSQQSFAPGQKIVENKAKNPHLKYALNNAGYGDSNKDLFQFTQGMLNRIGTKSANTGKILTADDVYQELGRLGLSTKNVNDKDGSWVVVSDGDRFNQQYLMNGNGYTRGGGGETLVLGNGKVAFYNDKGIGGIGDSLEEAKLLTDAIASKDRNSSASQTYLAMRSKQEEINDYLKEVADYRAALQLESETAARKAYTNQKLAERATKNAMSVGGLKKSGVWDKQLQLLQRDYEDAMKELNVALSEGMAELDEGERALLAAGNEDLAAIYASYAAENDAKQQAADDAFTVALFGGETGDVYRQAAAYVTATEDMQEKLSRIAEIGRNIGDGDLVAELIALI